MWFFGAHEILSHFIKKYTHGLHLLCYDTGTEVS